MKAQVHRQSRTMTGKDGKAPNGALTTILIDTVCYSLDVKPCFLGEPCIGVPTKFFCSSYISEGC